MKKTLSLLLFCLSLFTIAQIKYKEGYFITNNGSKTNCLIKDMAWKNHPSNIEYKESADGETKNANISNIKEFSVNNTIYRRFTFKVDNSQTSLNALNEDKNPVWINKTSFLKLLADGETQLYKFSQNANVKYFIKKTNSENVEQLVYKQFLVETKEQSFVQNNNDYKKQLDSINPNIGTSNVKYTDKSLINWFTQYTGKDNNESIKKEKGKFNIIPKIGFLSSNFEANYSSNKYDLGSKISISPSIEFEYIFAFNKNKWSAFAELIYRSYSNEKNIETTVYYTFVNKRLIELKNQSIFIPLGFKHHMFINDNSKISLGVALTSNIILKDHIKETDPTNNNVYVDYNNPNFNVFVGYQLGLGYTYKNKFLLEAKYISDSSLNLSSGKFYGLSLGYNIF
ncbi:outer membrane beta-barrel protein [Epilithonimonas sp.]|uniref:outer membrane beta-barrel protein n=1 Tax=Epilithonimonas sp. TaxID=2894511 RepID=UPI00289EEB30|nr:hypothetical protein [Epilithonimonas sp.]